MPLAAFLEKGNADPDTASAILALGRAAAEITEIIRRNGLGSSGDLGAATGAANTDGDVQKALDVRAEEAIIRHLQNDSGAAMLLSEEQAEPLALNDSGSVMVATDPLDGSSNINVNVTVGTIFSILPKAGGALQPGRNQRAAGFFTYGAQTTLITALADGTCHGFALDPDSGKFMLIDDAVRIAPRSNEFAINAAYARHWFPPVAQWFDNVLAGAEGPYGQGYRHRWVGSLVADAQRIFRVGGVFVYPADKRAGYGEGRLRLVYEAAPIAFLARRAGGEESNGVGSALDVTPRDLHQRSPLVFGSAEEVARLVELHQAHG